MGNILCNKNFVTQYVSHVGKRAYKIIWQPTMSYKDVWKAWDIAITITFL